MRIPQSVLLKTILPEQSPNNGGLPRDFQKLNRFSGDAEAFRRKILRDGVTATARELQCSRQTAYAWFERLFGIKLSDIKRGAYNSTELRGELALRILSELRTKQSESTMRAFQEALRRKIPVSIKRSGTRAIFAAHIGRNKV